MESENIIRKKLNRFADKLIDLSKRNKMINSNFQSRSKTHFRIIDEIPDLLYNKLLNNNNNMEFIPLPPLDSEPTDENTPEFKKEVFIKENTDQEYIENIQTIEQKQEDNLNEAHEKILRRLKDKVRKDIEFIDKDYDYSVKRSHKDILEQEYGKELHFYFSNLQKFKEELKLQDEEIAPLYKQVISHNCYKLSKNAPRGSL